MAKGPVRDMATAAMAIKRGDAKRIATEFRPSQGPFVRMKDFSNSPLARNPGSCIICELPFSEVRKAAPPAGRGSRRAGKRSCRDFVNRLTGDASPCKVFPCAAREGGGAGSLPRNLDNRILRMEFERRNKRLLGCQTDIRESKLNFFPVRGPKAPTESFKTESHSHDLSAAETPPSNGEFDPGSG